jgi:hypothetical protein
LSYNSGIVTSIIASESANCAPISSAVAIGLTVEQIAPMDTIAQNTTAKSGVFGLTSPTTSPLTTPRAASPAAT